MAILEKELDSKLNNDLLWNLVEVIEKDRNRKIPVIKFMRNGFLFLIADKLKNNRNKVNFIGITGESASGKSTFVRTFTKRIKEIEVQKNKPLLNFISSDNYFQDISAKIKEHGSFDNFLANENYNPDAPESFQLDLMRQDFLKLANDENIDIPEYKIDGTGRSIPNAIHINRAPIILSEGIAVFYPKVRDLFDVRVYVEVDEETRLQRYIERAVSKRNQKEEDALKQYDTINKSAKIYLRPQRKYADIIINGGASLNDIEKFSDDLSRCF